MSGPVADRLSQWKVELLRTALDRRGLSSMLERQRAVEAVVRRSVANIRELSSAEATAVLEALTSAAAKRSSSSWDDRDGDTWIYRL